MNKIHEEMKQQARAEIIEILQSGFTDYYCDLHNEVFNTDYYIIGTWKAEKHLEKYGVFEAIHLIQEYMDENFGESYKEFDNPEKVVNMLHYIIGEEVINEISEKSITFNEKWNEAADEETNTKIINEIESEGK